MTRPVLKSKATSFRLEIFDYDAFIRSAAVHDLTPGVLAEKIVTHFVRDAALQAKVFRSPAPPPAANPPVEEPECDHASFDLIAGGMRKCRRCSKVRGADGVYR